MQDGVYAVLWNHKNHIRTVLMLNQIFRLFGITFLKRFLIAVLFGCSISHAQSNMVPGWDETGVANFNYWLTNFAVPSAAGAPSQAPINKTFATDGQEIFTLSLASAAGFNPKLQNFHGLSLNGFVKLRSANSLVRIILVDSTSKEHLIYETYPLIVSNMAYPLANVCEETCFLDPLDNSSIRIELIDATLILAQIVYQTSAMALPPGMAATQKQIKRAQNVARIGKIRQQIRDRGLKWIAAETSISALPFDQKRKFFGIPTISSFPPPPGENAPQEDIIRNLQGAEYYKGGIFELRIGSGSLPVPQSNLENGLVDSYDWRNRHGANDPDSPYYDGDPSGSGWITSVKNQSGCGSCWSFAATGATEALANLYFNQHLDLDLAEQDALSCSEAGSCDGGYPSGALDFYTYSGVVDEACFPYTATDQACANKCAYPIDQLQISGRKTFGLDTPITEDALKRLIIENGPVSGGVYSLGHAMTLVGYEKDPDDEQTVWIFKNSWGTGYGENGYWKIKTPISNIGWTHALKIPVIPIVSPYP
jgi:hypothetical protein